MKKTVTKIVCTSLVAAMLLPMAACGTNGSQAEGDGLLKDNVVADGAGTSYFEIDSFKNNSDGDAYDSSLFYRNELSIFGADASSLYVPEGRYEDGDERKQYEGYYYMYPSATNLGDKGILLQRNIDENGVVYKATNPVYRSKDLVNWELCGALDGTFSTRIEMDSWAESGILAPDPIYDPVSGKYWLYEQTNSKLNGEAYPDTLKQDVVDKLGATREVIANNGNYDSKTFENSEFYNEATIREQIRIALENPNSPVSKLVTNPNSEFYEMDENSPALYNKYRWLNTFYVGVYVSDTPVGPFTVATSEDLYGDAQMPNGNGKVITNQTTPFNIAKDVQKLIAENPDKYDAWEGDIWGTLDAHPFIDEDGQMYLYFCHHVTTDWSGVDIWGMKMKDPLTPDYTTMTWLVRGGYTTVKKNSNWARKPWSMNSYDMGPEYVLENGMHGEGNEGAFVMRKDNRYFLIYSGGGYNNKYYDMMQTTSDTGPLGPFTKPSQYASSICGTSFDNDWNMGSGHGSILTSPSGEMYILGWGHADDTFNAPANGRWYVVDRVHWVNHPQYGTLLYGNGPSKSLQPKMSDVTGYKNIASEATISVRSSGANSGKQYLNDGLFVSHDEYKNWEFKTTGATEITLTFSEPKTIRSVMVYNSYNYDYAFKGIDYIELNLAEKPDWYTFEQYTPYARITDIPFNSDFIGTKYDYVRSGAACLASFKEVKVNSVTIFVSKKIKDLNKEIRISDIMVLGK